MASLPVQLSVGWSLSGLLALPRLPGCPARPKRRRTSYTTSRRSIAPLTHPWLHRRPCPRGFRPPRAIRESRRLRRVRHGNHLQLRRRSSRRGRNGNATSNNASLQGGGSTTSTTEHHEEEEPKGQEEIEPRFRHRSPGSGRFRQNFTRFPDIYSSSARWTERIPRVPNVLAQPH